MFSSLKQVLEINGGRYSNEKDFKKLGDNAVGTLVSKGYVFNRLFGWEKPEILKRFNLDPEMTGLPAKDYFDDKGKKSKVADDNWIDYVNYKKEQAEKEQREQEIIDNIIN